MSEDNSIDEEGNDDLAEYEVLEFCLFQDSTLRRFADFYANLRTKPYLSEANNYDLVDEALLDTGLPSLRDGYTDLILARSNDSGYPAKYCTELAMDCTDSAGESCVWPTDNEAVSAICIDATVEIDNACPDEPQDMHVTLENPTNPNIQMLLDGTLHEANTPVPFDGTGKIWVINTNHTDGSSSASSDSLLKFEDKAECGNPYIKILEQYFSSSASAAAWDGPVSIINPTSAASGQTYLSSDDLIQGSHITTYVQYSPDVRVDVEPLGLNAWQTAPCAGAAYQREGGPVYNAVANSSLSTDTDSDTTSMTTRGEQTASGSFTGGEFSSAAVSNSSRYTFEIGLAPVELTLSWACDMTGVQVIAIDPDEKYQSLLAVSNGYNDSSSWECGTRNWTLAPESNIQISIATAFQDTLNESLIGSQNGGGSFEINLQAILPE